MGETAVEMEVANATGARRGEVLLERLRRRPPNLWYGGERVTDPTDHPAIGRGIHTLASLYDMQFDEPAVTLFDSPETGRPVGRSFMIPRTQEDLRSVGASMMKWASASFGLMGRLPDYINRSISGYAGGAEFLGRADIDFAENMRRYHSYVREHDLCLTHTLSSPQANRSKHASEQGDPFLAAKVKEETSEGIVIRGCRMLATLPVSDEIMVFPSTFLKNEPEHAGYAYAFCIPSNTEGLKFLCRESMDYGRSRYDHPLGSRFEEMDAVVMFDDVFVPWDRVFMYGEPDLCNRSYAQTGAVAHMAHQVVVKNVAKTEYLLGLASLIADTIAIERFQHIQEKIAEIWVNLETMKAFLRCAEVDADTDEWGVMRPAWDPLDAARNLYPRLYPRMIEIIRQMGASGLVAMPTEADVNGPMADEIQRYFQAARAEAHDRIPLFRLAWDTAMSSFATRQVLYERYFFGDPVRMAGMLVQSHDRTAYMDRIRDFLKEPGTEPMQTPVEPYDVVLFGTLACEQGAVLEELLPEARLVRVKDSTASEDMARVLAEARIMLSLKYTADMPPAPRLEFFQVAGSGWDGVAVDHLPPGVVVANADGHAEAIAEYVVLSMLLHCSTFLEADRSFRAGSWHMSGRTDGPLGRELSDCTVGVLGLGGIGVAVSERARALGARVIACTRTPTAKAGLADSVVGFDAMAHFLEQCDFVVVATALGRATLHLIGASELASMRSTAVLINVARGEVVEEDALYDALRGGMIGGAVIDAWYRYPSPEEPDPAPSRHPFHELDNVLMTPHSSAWTSGMLRRRWGFIASNIARFARGIEPQKVVHRT